jgi:hypothetical protein
MYSVYVGGYLAQGGGYLTQGGGWFFSTAIS